jgi:predicted ATPase
MAGSGFASAGIRRNRSTGARRDRVRRVRTRALRFHSPPVTVSIKSWFHRNYLAATHDRIQHDAQFIIAPHSPIITTYPDPLIYELSDNGLRAVDYHDTRHDRITRSS